MWTTDLIIFKELFRLVSTGVIILQYATENIKYNITALGRVPEPGLKEGPDVQEKI